MSHGIADDLLEVELQAELELMCEDDSIPYADGMAIEDIFSSSEGDYKLFELNENEPISENVVENQSIWKSYFAKVSSEQHIYLNESQNILSETRQTCVDTLTLCNIEREEEKEKQSSDEIEENQINIETEEKQPELKIMEEKQPRLSHDVCTLIQEEMITTNPCIPYHVTSTPPSVIMNSTEPLSPYLNLNQTNCESVDRDNYNRELVKLENELKQVTQSHEEQQQQTNTATFSWSTLLHQSKALYDQYMETTHKIKRDKERLVMIEYFSDWKCLYQQNKRKKLQLIKLTQHMEHTVHRLVEQAMTTSHTVSRWSAFILTYRHKMNMNRIRSHALWKSCVVDYVIFHYEQTYQSAMSHRTAFKLKCLPLIYDRAACLKQQRALKIWKISVMKISIWYKHHKNKKELIRMAGGIYRLCMFRNKHIDNPLPVMRDTFMSWIDATKSRKCTLKSIRNKLIQQTVHKNICCWRDQTRYNNAKRTIICFRKSRKERRRYLEHNAALRMQSYFRMFHIRSITNDVQCKLSAINDMFAINNQIEEEFKTLDSSEYILDDTIIDWDLKPLSNPPTPPLSPTLDKNDDNESSQGNDSSLCDSSESEEESQTNEESVETEETQLPQNECTFKSEQVAKSWLKRKKKFNRKKKPNNALSKLNRFNKMKQKSHTFGVGNRFKNHKKKKPNKESKPKLVKFGCP